MEINFPPGLYGIYTGLYTSVEDPSLDSVVSWGKSNRSFVIWNEEEFKKILANCYGRKFTDLSSVLEFHGFARISGTSGPLEFASSNFVRGQPELLSNMRAKVYANIRRMYRGANIKDAKDKAKKTAVAFQQMRI